MLRNLDDLYGHALRATDGDIGTVQDVYIDDARWTVRYFVVETGSWLASRKVLISPVSLTSPHPDDKVLSVSITREQVKNSPNIDTDKPVSRQHEIDYLGYYGYPTYWDGGGLWGAGAMPGLMIPEPGLVPADPLSAAAGADPALAADLASRHAHDDPHLRSCKSITGYHLQARDGEIGHVDGWVIDEDTWAVRYLVVDTSNWWRGRRVLLAPQWIHEVDWGEAKVVVEMTQEAIKRSPPWDALPTREQEMGLYAHYDRAGYW